MNRITVPAAERIVVISGCAAKKLARPAPAGELYVGGYFQACRAAAEALTADGGTVLVLSVKYGLVRPDKVLKPYEMTLGDRGAISGLYLEAQARQLGLADSRDVTVLAGAAYTALARNVWPMAEAPLTGLRISQQLARLAEIREDAAGRGTVPRIEAEFARTPMYDVEYDYRQGARPFTVVIAGPGRHAGEGPLAYVVEAHSTEKAWAKALSWYMADSETVDAFVVAGESFEGVPAQDSTLFWLDLRPEFARREALNDLADDAAEALATFREATRGLDVKSDAYREAFTAASAAAWPMLRELGANDGRE
ncbi:hypothetical protein OV450_1399 [Actinobacteria bacterium OV450]|nr:hypothetical protein OV450_1399 [Actinobacteria bacterium OV450]